jgi:hypothetical protein
VLDPNKNKDFGELRMLEITFSHYWSDVIGFRKGEVCTVKGNTLCTLADNLRQISNWAISRRFCLTLEPLIHGGVDDNLLSY